MEITNVSPEILLQKNITHHNIFLYLNGHFVLGKGPAPKQLVDTVNGKKSCDVGTEVVGHCDPHSMGRNHLHKEKTAGYLNT